MMARLTELDSCNESLHPQIQKPFGTKNYGSIGLIVVLYWGYIGIVEKKMETTLELFRLCQS